MWQKHGVWHCLSIWVGMGICTKMGQVKKENQKLGHYLQPSPVVAECGGYPVLHPPACLKALYRPED